MIISYTQFSRSQREGSDKIELVADASDLGIPAGFDFPKTIQIQGKRKLVTFTRHLVIDAREREIVGATYTAPGIGVTVFIIND